MLTSIAEVDIGLIAGQSEMAPPLRMPMGSASYNSRYCRPATTIVSSSNDSAGVDWQRVLHVSRSELDDEGSLLLVTSDSEKTVREGHYRAETEAVLNGILQSTSGDRVGWKETGTSDCVIGRYQGRPIKIQTSEKQKQVEIPCQKIKGDVLVLDRFEGEQWPSKRKGPIFQNRVVVGDCDCAACLDEELSQVKREILCMIAQQNPEVRTQRTAVRSAGADVVGDTNWRYVYLRRADKGRGLSGASEEELEDEFPTPNRQQHRQTVMVSGGGNEVGGVLGHSDMAKATTSEKTGAVTVEGQLSALLTSSSKELLSSTGATGRHTNLIENQLLTLEDQFWTRRGKSTGAGVTGTKEELQEANEDTALLAEQSQQVTMSDSTPVKRPMKVTVSGGSSVVMDDDAMEGVGAGTRTGVANSPSTNLSRMKRFEQFLKSLVGKKSSPGPLAGDLKDNPGTAAGPGKFFEHPAIKVQSTMEFSSKGLGATDEDGDPEDVPLRRPSFGSMSSLNSAVQQKFLNYLPTSSSALSLAGAKRNLSVNNLSTIPERRSADGVTSARNGVRVTTEEGRLFARRLAPMGMGQSNPRRTTGRGLKTVSCSFSNFEQLHQGASTGQGQGTSHLANRLRSEEGGGSGEERIRLEVDRSRNGDSGLLKMSKSTNHLQSMVSGGPVKPLNRFRNSLFGSSVSQVNLVTDAHCSRCSSILSLAGGTMGKVRCSDSSVDGGGSSGDRELSGTDGSSVVAQEVIVVTQTKGSGGGGASVEGATPAQSCKLCLGEVSPQQLTEISQCRCMFCTDCMRAYIEFEILEGAYEISCPDAMCPAQGVVTMQEIAALTSSDLVLKHNRYRLNREVELDKNRTWCPRAGCDTVCMVDSLNQPSSSATPAMISVITSSPSSSSSTGKNATLVAYAVRCPTCEEEFCSACKKTWHPRLSCEENIKKLAADGHMDSVGIPFDSDLIKCCPMCGVPIEKDEGCAQMMCKRCKHVFCWYCLASLDDDFLLRHYDKGPCKNKLGHSRASVVWHRAQVIGIFAGFGILLLVASPLLLLAAPCIVCCKCRICSGGPKIEEEHEFDDPLTLHR